MPLTVAQAILVVENLGLITWTLKRQPWRLTLMDWDDLWQEGCKGLMHAAQHFDPARGVKFCTFACPAIRWAALNAVKRDRDVLGQAERLTDQIAEKPDENPGLPPEVAREIRCAVGELPDKERECINRRFWDGELLHHIGARWGVGKERVRQIELAAKNRLRPRLRHLACYCEPN